MANDLKIILGIGIVTIGIIIGAAVFMGGSNSVESSLLVRENSSSIGPALAKVTIVEFSDFQCPACLAGQPTIKKILEEYKGKIRFVYRHFPIPSHTYGDLAAQVAEAATAQGKFWEMHDKLFENQPKWSESSNPHENFTLYARELQIDIEKFNQDLDKNAYSNIVTQDKNDGNSLLVNATPTFFINKEKVTGVPQHDLLKEIIDSYLNQ